METAKEYWIERFGEPPQSEEEKWAIAMMTEYAEYCFNESKKNNYKTILSLPCMQWERLSFCRVL